ncbi:MAG: hypothetical protein HYR56_34800 [Acidobacteria bacterium]|nr:hypothetical protein [Acidobacteriota bacterium]
MRAARAQHRPTIQNKPVVKRRAASSVARRAAGKLSLVKQPGQKPARRRATATPQRRRQQVPAVQPNGMNVFGAVLFAGALLALVFVTALHWQRQALQLGQQEVELRSQIDLSANEQRQLQVEQNRARSPRETADRSRQAGLAQYKLDERPFGYKPKPAAKGAKPGVNEANVLHSVTPPER